MTEPLSLTGASSGTGTGTGTGTLGSALDLLDVSVTLGGRVVVRDVTLSFAAGRRHAVIGKSGAGKSVLMKAVAGLLPRSGRVHVARAPLVFVHQDPALLDGLDVEENVAFASSRRGIGRSAVDDALRALHLEDVREKLASALPVAVQKRVALARALCLAPGVLVVDEPTTGLDVRAAAAVDDALASLDLARTTLIVITHSPRTLHRLAPDVVVVDNGRAAPLARRAA